MKKSFRKRLEEDLSGVGVQFMVESWDRGGRENISSRVNISEQREHVVVLSFTSY